MVLLCGIDVGVRDEEVDGSFAITYRNTYYESLVARFGIILVLILNTLSVNNANRDSIKPVPCRVTYIYRGQLLRILLLNK